MPIIVVTAAVIEKDGKVLLTQRNANTSQAGKWEFPGGKMEFGETPEECLAREILEELNIRVEVGTVFHVVSHVYEDAQVVLLCYRCAHLSGNIAPLQCRDFDWANEDSVLNFDLAPADIPVAEKWVEQYRNK